ncbi:hypothetical protein R1sor_020423 [Riccia sorocarpa]|uniref:Uncharacterized protein n=1 Tax=Riccia sorocarpa TaxID=122646 RepID=A0ABD3IJL6_9MARC
MTDEPIATQTPIQTTPRLRPKKLAEGPLGPDDVHRIVTHDMIYCVFPEFVTVGRHKEFKSEACRSHIRVMKDCTSVAMIDVLEEGFLSGAGETSGLLESSHDVASTPHTQTPKILRRVRSRVSLGGEIDVGESGTWSYAAIVPHGEGSSSAPSPSSHTRWLPPPYCLPQGSMELD